MWAKNVVVFLLVNFDTGFGIAGLLRDVIGSVNATIASAALDFVFLLFQGGITFVLGVVGGWFVEWGWLALFIVD